MHPWQKYRKKLLRCFVYTNPEMVFKKLLTIILCIGISMVGYANQQNYHEKFRKYQTYNGIENTSRN